jgi:PhnB protein
VSNVCPYLTVRNGTAAIDFYKQAFEAEETFRMARDDGALEHATLLIGETTVYLSDEGPGASKSPETLGGSPVMLHLVVPDCDAVWARALAAGGTEVEPMADQGWGDRWGLMRDPFGHLWGITTEGEQTAE